MSTSNESLTTQSPDATEDFAAKFAASLKGGSVLVLSGGLGSGKTTFIRGLARGLGINPRTVSSPSYTIINIYEGNSRLVHVDLYRLGDESEVSELGLEDLFDETTITAIEWGERLPESIRYDVRILFDISGDSERQISIEQ